ncbi:MAG: hypothetical protein J7J76_02300, partial [Candidatus Latescibacteria bacterium]|nr:hypothetical protein [Candidatus Latescibacterota bacterium]
MITVPTHTFATGSNVVQKAFGVPSQKEKMLFADMLRVFGDELSVRRDLANFTCGFSWQAATNTTRCSGTDVTYCPAEQQKKIEETFPEPGIGAEGPITSVGSSTKMLLGLLERSTEGIPVVVELVGPIGQKKVLPARLVSVASQQGNFQGEATAGLGCEVVEQLPLHLILEQITPQSGGGQPEISSRTSGGRALHHKGNLALVFPDGTAQPISVAVEARTLSGERERMPVLLHSVAMDSSPTPEKAAGGDKLGLSPKEASQSIIEGFCSEQRRSGLGHLCAAKDFWFRPTVDSSADQAESGWMLSRILVSKGALASSGGLVAEMASDIFGQTEGETPVAVELTGPRRQKSPGTGRRDLPKGAAETDLGT